jgi:hypothetical protein
MRVKTVEQAAELAGTIWEQDKLQRQVVRVENIATSRTSSHIRGNVYWKRPGAPVPRKLPQWLPYFNDWLAKATPVNDKAKAMQASCLRE